MVMDHYNKKFYPYIYPQPTPNTPWTQPPKIDTSELQKLIEEFNRAVEAAKTVDILTEQPDCEDPEKVALVDRVKRLEELLGVEKPGNGPLPPLK